MIKRVLQSEQSGVTVLSAAFLDAPTKDEAISSLSVRAGELCDDLTAAEIERLVFDREAIVSSIVAEQIAFPHAVKPGISDNIVVIGVSSSPIDWGMPGQAIRVAVLFAGGDQYHLRTMGIIARILRYDSVLESLLNAQTEQEIVDIVAAHAEVLDTARKGDIRNDLNQSCIDAGRDIQRRTPNAALILMGDTFTDVSGIESVYSSFVGYILCDRCHGTSTESVKWIEGVRTSFWDPGLVQRELIRLLMDGVFGDDEILIVLSGIRGSNRISSIRVVRRDEASGERLLPHIDAAVSGRVLEIAEELGREGREGKAIGALFVIGRIADIAPYTHQLIVNPFLGYPEEARNILDPSLDETIKEFSKIDGAFVIDVDGTVVSAGTYLAVSPERLDHHPGEGARHASARGITAVTESLSIAVSESTGRVSVYLKGQRRY